MEKIAFIGLGNMGGPMALRLVNAGYAVRAFDINPEVLANCAKAGADPASSAIDAAGDAKIVITMLPEDRHVKDLYLGQGGLIDAVKPNTVLIDCSTISPHTSRQVAEYAETKGLAMLDAPVSGGTVGAANGTLAFMVGGDVETFKRCRPIFDVMGKSIFHVGPKGAGQSVKICNNMLAAILMAGTAEALAFGVKSGIDPAVLSSVISQSSGQNFMISKWNPWPDVDPASPASNGYSGGFQTRLMLKDLNLATASAAEFQASIPVASVTKSLLAMHMQQTPEDAGKDFSSMIKLFNPKSN
jgi:3-hydroxyisobutyrate dehydrogenase